jgi:isoquinoline 1-oxidoreductase beta subunit
MQTLLNLSRRRFLQSGAAAAGGLVLGFHLPAGGRLAGAAAGEAAINAWLSIAPDDTITVTVAHSEMGQGVYTSLPMLVAEELEVDWTRVRARFAPAEPVYRNRMFGIQGTGGSTSIRASFDHLRQAGATAREMLRRAAAEGWGVPLEQCEAEGGRVVHGASGRAAGYGALAAAAATLEPPAEVALKQPADWALIGKPLPRLDVPAKVDGSAGFGIDVQVPDMLIATVKASPVFGGKLKSVDEKPAFAVKGVRAVVPLESAVVVVAEGYWPAQKGLEVLDPVWDEGPHAAMSDATIRAELSAALEQEGVVARDDGAAAEALAGAAKRLEAVYEVPYLAHATMEPMNATAHVTAEGVEVWAPTQGQGPIQHAVAGLLGIEPGRVAVHTTFLGGGFGRRFETDFVVQAVLASKAVGKPVKLVWSREEDMRQDFYRPAAMARLSAGLDGAGNPVAWHARLASPSIMSRALPQLVKDGIDPSSVEGVSDTPYGVANLRVEYAMRHFGVPVGFWRSVGHSQNAFFVESFLDELAHAARRDPLAYRLGLLGDHPRHRKVLETAAEAAGWGRPAPEGRFRGLALHESFGSIVAEVAEISVAEGKKITLHRMACAIDCGRVVNPDTVVAQMESGIVYALTAALFGRVTIAEGRVGEGNFDRYPMLQLAQMPEVEVRIVESGAALGGIGEPSTPPAAPALANALFAATGARLRSLPLSRHGYALA